MKKAELLLSIATCLLHIVYINYHMGSSVQCGGGGTVIGPILQEKRLGLRVGFPPLPSTCRNADGFIKETSGTPLSGPCWKPDSERWPVWKHLPALSAPVWPWGCPARSPPPASPAPQGPRSPPQPRVPPAPVSALLNFCIQAGHPLFKLVFNFSFFLWRPALSDFWAPNASQIVSTSSHELFTEKHDAAILFFRSQTYDCARIENRKVVRTRPSGNFWRKGTKKRAKPAPRTSPCKGSAFDSLKRKPFPARLLRQLRIDSHSSGQEATAFVCGLFCLVMLPFIHLFLKTEGFMDKQFSAWHCHSEEAVLKFWGHSH